MVALDEDDSAAEWRPAWSIGAAERHPPHVAAVCADGVQAPVGLEGDPAVRQPGRAVGRGQLGDLLGRATVAGHRVQLLGAAGR